VFIFPPERGEVVMWIVALILSIVLGSGTAAAFECIGVTLPSSLVICSDPELMRLTDERQEAINEARARIGEEAWPALWEDQKAWVRSYATACSVPPDRPPPMPVPASIIACFKRSAEARIAYIRAYGSPGGASPEPPNVTTPSRQAPRPEPERPRVAACADTDWGCLSMRMREGMSEQEVMNAMGYRPNKVEMTTCGSQTPQPWSCKKYTFGGSYNAIMVLFERGDEGNWLVNSWTVFP
jgi:hypothetical protein